MTNVTNTRKIAELHMLMTDMSLMCNTQSPNFIDNPYAACAVSKGTFISIKLKFQ